MSQVNNLEGVLHAKKTNVRWHIVIILFIITAVSVGDRSTLAIAGKDMSAALGINPGQMGWVFSAFAWAYCLAQIPGGWLLDRFGSKKFIFAAFACGQFSRYCKAVWRFSTASAQLFALPFCCFLSVCLKRR